MEPPLLTNAGMNAEDWKTVLDRAAWLLRNADQAPPRENLQGMALQLRLWHYPPCGRRNSWCIFLPARDLHARAALVREASWDPSRVRRRGAPAEPDIRIRDAEVDRAELRPYLSTAGGLQPGGTGVVAASATATSVSGVEGSRGLSHVRLAWRGRGPRPCASTRAWFVQFRRLLARAFRSR